jgi:hypothetical protein
MAVAVIPKDTLQEQVAKSLEVSERLYDLLVEKFEILDANRRTFPAGSPDQDIFVFNFTNTKYEGYLVLIHLAALPANCTLQLLYDYFGNNFSDTRTLVSTTTSVNSFFQIVAYRGAKIRLRVVSISGTATASTQQILAIKKVLPVSL